MPTEDESFDAGYECGSIAATLSSWGWPILKHWVFTSNLSRLDTIARQNNYHMIRAGKKGTEKTYVEFHQVREG